MYDSRNLPLSPRKVVKKTLARLWKPALFFLLFALPYSVLLMNGGDSAFDDPYRGVLRLVTLVIILYPLIIVLHEYFYYKFYFYKFDEDRAEVKKGVLSSASGFVRYEKLQNVYLDQDVLDRIFGLYDVHFETAGERSGFYSHVDGLNQENAQKLIDFLNGRISQPAIPSAAVGPETNAAPVKTIASDAILSRQNCPISPLVILSGTLSGFFILCLFGVFLLAIIGRSLVAFNWFAENPELVVPIIIVALIGIFVLSFINELIWYQNFDFTFSEERGEIRTKVISQSVSYLNYNRIQNVNVNQGIFDRFLGLYNLSIETAGEQSGRKLILSGFNWETSDRIKNFLLSKTQSSARSV